MFDLLKETALLEKYPTTLATVDDEGQPNIAIVADVKIVDEKTLIIAHQEMRKTIENLKSGHQKVCLTCFNLDWEGVKLTGEAKYENEGDKMALCQELFTTKKNAPQGVIVVTVEKLERLK